jgi:hypothetical protein
LHLDQSRDLAGGEIHLGDITRNHRFELYPRREEPFAQRSCSEPHQNDERIVQVRPRI